MDAASAAKLMAEYRLVPKGQAKRVLEAVADGTWGDIQPNDDLVELRLRYQRVLRDRLENRPAFPRNLPFYLLVQDKYPDFRWEVVEDDAGTPRVHFENMPTLGKLRPSLLSLLLDRVPATSNRSDMLALQLADLPPELVDALRDTFVRADAARPTPAEIEEIGQWLRKGLAGEELTVFTPICPDYAYEETGNPALPYRVTFDGLGDGIGIVAGRALLAVPLFVENMRRCGLNVHSVIGSGDFEAFSTENLERLKLSETQFLDKVQSSSDTFRAQCTIEVESLMITDMCGGRSGWERLIDETHRRLESRDYGEARLDPKSIRRILAARKKLYEAWFERGPDPEAYLDVLHAQGAEYAVMGKIVAQRYAHPLVLGADHPAMRPFYGVHGRMPVIYLRGVY